MPLDRIYLSSPDVGEIEEQSLIRAFRSGWIAPLGPEVDAFERELAEYCDRKFAVALSSGTAALHLALLSLGVKRGDYVLTSSMTFAATANAICYIGAIPVFVDCDETGNMNPELLETAFKHLESEQKQVKIVLPVDLLGKVADQESIRSIAEMHNATVLCDSAESLGARRNGKPAASFGEAAAVSFNGNKVMTTSGGGALLTDSEKIANYVRHLSTQARQPVVHYEHTEVGFNYRMSNILAALGRAQLSRLDEMIEVRRQHRNRYIELFSKVDGVSVFGEPSESGDGQTQDNFWLTSIVIDPKKAGFSANDLRAALDQANIESRPLWKPMHLQPVFSKHRHFTDGTSEKLFVNGLSLPSGSVINDIQMGRVHKEIQNFFDGKADV